MANAAHVVALKYDASRAGLNPTGMGRKALSAWSRFYRFGIMDKSFAKVARREAVALAKAGKSFDSSVPAARVFYKLPWWTRLWYVWRRSRLASWILGRVDGP